MNDVLCKSHYVEVTLILASIKAVFLFG